MNRETYMLKVLEKLVNIPSPSGYAHHAISYLAQEAEKMGFSISFTNRGALLVHVPGQKKDRGKLCLAAHVDTLGAVVRSITEEGDLRLVPVGGYMMESIEGEYCTVHTRDGRQYEGTILTVHPSVHSFDDARTMAREEKNMVVRLDEMVNSKEDVKALGICNGDVISLDPRFRITKSGYIKSRHLDDKASAAVLMCLLQEISRKQVLPAYDMTVLFTNYEEVGFGASYLPSDITEMIAVDMGAVGDDMDGKETKVSICTKDASGPYDYAMTTCLIDLAKEKNLDYAVDVFRHYRSDASAAREGGNDIRCALIGQGVQASHHMERTHIRGMVQTLELLIGYTERI